MASTDGRPIPIKNTAYRVTFPILDADGDLVTGAAGLDSEISKDGGGFSDCSAEATEIATNSGMYYLDLTAGEMNADTVAIIVKTSTVGAKTTPMVMYPQEAGDAAPPAAEIADAVWDELMSGHTIAGSYGLGVRPLRANAGTIVSSTTLTLDGNASTQSTEYVGCLILLVSDDTFTYADQIQLITAYNGSTKRVTLSPGINSGSNPAGFSPKFVILGSGPTQVQSVNASALTSIASAIWDEAQLSHQTAGTYGLAMQPVRANTSGAVTTTTIVLDASASAQDSAYVGNMIILIGQVGFSDTQARLITAYVGSTKTATISPALTSGLYGTQKYIIVPSGTTNVNNISASAITATSIASDAITAAKIATDAIDADALAADAVTEIWAKAMSDLSAVPGATASVLSAVNWLYTIARNRRTQTATTETVLKDDGTTTIGTSTKSDDGTTMVRGKYA